MNTLEEDLQEDTMPEAYTPAENKPQRTQWNWVQASGRVASEVEKKTVKDQTVIQFTLMFETRRKTDKEGSHVNFIDIELWGKMADLFHPMLKKGIEIIVTGELFQQRWVGKDGKRAQKFCISAQALAISDQTFRPN
ncbi:MAG: single-stranded DNA-binding protein [Spirochaetes bacterium]|nr:single-stranded DNA-binding protein [Spirochaetota bacterium]MBX3722682.1 single-stranded DNA-binding protein [Turneriella sp.]